MILGIGNDMADVRRIEQTLNRFGSRFEERCFTPHERARAQRRPAQSASTYAKRFAAKEACAKALGTGMRKGVFWADMGVINLPSGQPTLQLTGGALVCLMELVPPGYLPHIHLSLSDELPYALAFVVIEARPQAV